MLLAVALGRSRAQPSAAARPVRAHFVDESRRILAGRRLRDGADTRRISMAGRASRIVSFRWCEIHSLAATGGPTSAERSLQPAGVARWNAVDRHLPRPRELGWRRADRLSGARRRLRDVPARRPRRHGLGRRTREQRPSCAKSAADGRNVTSRMADSALSSGVWRRTARVSCGLARIPGFGDGNPDLPSDSSCRARSAT